MSYDSQQHTMPPSTNVLAWGLYAETHSLVGHYGLAALLSQAHK